MSRGILDFFDVPAAVSFDLPPEQAISYFRAKGLRPTFAWQDMLGEEHATSFTVAKMMDNDLLADVHESLAQALEQGTPFREWADTITQTLQAKGWWGRQEVLDPLTGQPIVAQLGSASRLRTIFRTNIAGAYAAGSWQQIQDQAEDAPFLLYDAVDDYRTRPEHAAWDGRVYPIGHPFWRDHYPPNGWNCRCSVIQLSDEDVESLGLQVSTDAPSGTYQWENPRTGKVERIPNGLDPGFDYNAGEVRARELTRLAIEKARALPEVLQPAALEGLRTASDEADNDVPAFRDSPTGEWHRAAFSAAPNWVKRAVAKQADVEIQYKAESGRAWASRGRTIDMSVDGFARSKQRSGQATWRHEFGHIIDARLGDRPGYRSMRPDFRAAMDLDRAKVYQRPSKKWQAVLQGREDAYEELREKMIDTSAAERETVLRQLAVRAGIDYDDFIELVRRDLNILDDTTPSSLGTSVRLAKMIKAVELGDPETFVKLSTFLDVPTSESTISYKMRREAWTRSGEIAKLSDLFGALTRNKVCDHHNGYYGHSNSYYSAPRGMPYLSNDSTEIFANLTALAGAERGLWWTLANKFAPDMSRLFREIIDGSLQ